MKRYSVNFMKNGELFEIVVEANNSDEARNYISIKENIPMKFEIGKCEDENNHVGAVIEL